jgi:hypothetical protein
MLSASAGVTALLGDRNTVTLSFRAGSITLIMSAPDNMHDLLMSG